MFVPARIIGCRTNYTPQFTRMRVPGFKNPVVYRSLREACCVPDPELRLMIADTMLELMKETNRQHVELWLGDGI